MGLTFAGYIGIHVACGIGIFIITGIILALLAIYSHGVYRFFMTRMLGVEFEYKPNSEPNSPEYITIKVDQMAVKSKHRSVQVFFLWFIGTTTLTLALMVLYEGCILASAGVYYGDDCPSDPMTCFASTDNKSSSEVGIFECVPGNKTVFPGNTNKAWCYGWVVKRQTVSSVINQIGVCGGILSVIGMLFAFMFRSVGGEDWQKCIYWLLFLLSIGMIPMMIAIAAALHISFSVLAYLVTTEVTILFLTVNIFQEDGHGGNDTISEPSPVEITPVSN